MRDLLLLLKVQLPAAMRGSSKRQNKGKRSGGYTALMAVSLIIIIAFVAVFFVGLSVVLAPAGMLYIVPALAMSAACAFCLFTSIYLTHGLLFSFKDYDLVMSLPFKTSTIVASRITILYFWNLLFVLSLMAPALCIYGYFAQPPATFYILYIIGMLLAPLLPTILATIIGSIIAIIASHFQKQSYMNLVLTILFLVVWMLFVFNLDSLQQRIAVIGPQLYQIITNIYPPARWFTQGVCELNGGMFLLYVGVSVGAFIAFCAVVGHFFRDINSSLSADRTKSNYTLTALKGTGVRKALMKKELKRLTSSSTTLLNTCIGGIMAPIMAILMLFTGGEAMGSLMEASEFVGGDIMALAVTMFVSFFIMLIDTTAATISLEGKNLWIVRSAPVSGKVVLQAKLLLNFIVVLIASIPTSIILIIAMHPSIVTAVFMIITPIIFGAFSTAFGQKLNLKYPNFDWNNETQVVKRDKPVTILSISVIGIGLGCMFASFFGGIWVAFIADAVLLVLSLLVYHNLMTKGAAEFDSFPA